MTDSTISEKMKELNKNLKPKEEKMAENSQADLTKQLDTILANLRDVINKRNQKIADLRSEIEKLEQENTELDGKINSILSDI
jgi:predicted  nucleic acid-binding Zn-ribbon protein